MQVCQLPGFYGPRAMSGGGASSASERLHRIFSAAICLALLSTLLLIRDGDGEAQTIARCATTSIPPELVFPNATASMVSDSDNLSRVLSGVMVLGTVISQNTTNGGIFDTFICHPSEGSADVYDSPHELFVILNGYDSGSVLETYYTDRGRFVGLKASIGGEGLRIPSIVEAVPAADALALGMGIPSDLSSDVLSLNVSHVDTDGSGRKTWYNETMVRLSSGPLEGRPVSQFNMFGLIFNEDRKSITYVESWLFVRPSVNITLSADAALLIGRNASLNSLPEDHGVLLNESIEGIRFDADSMRFGYEYVSKWNSESKPEKPFYFIVVSVVDCENGSVLYTHDYLRPWVPEGPHRANLGEWLPFILVIAAGSVVIVGLAAFCPEALFIALASAAVPLYIRMRGTGALNNFSRGKIYGFILARPGITLTELKSELSMGTGGVVYHLQVLEQLELVKSVKEGKFRHWYAVGVKVIVDVEHLIGSTEAEVLSHVEKSGPTANVDIAKALGYSRQRTHYNLKLLQQRGLVEPIGRQWRTIQEGSSENEKPAEMG